MPARVLACLFASAVVSVISLLPASACTNDAQCADGQFCNGVELCVAGSCVRGVLPCEGRLCDESTDVCVGTGVVPPKMGEALPGLTGPEAARFLFGRSAFDRVFSPAEGLGPVFNQHSCGSCHNTPLGGSGTQAVTRFGFVDEESEVFDPLESLGGSLRQAQAIRPECAEVVPGEANVTAQRVTNSALGFGLVEAVADADIEARANIPPPGVSGRVHYVQTFENPGPTRVGRFGWKAQVATVLTFSADAALNEMGITNRFVTTENDPNGVNAPTLAAPDFCDTVPDPEDQPDAGGVEFIDRVTDFQRFLAAPPQTPPSGMTGETIAQNIGCFSCHAPSFTTRNDAALEGAIRNRPLRPYSDFLIHDMGLAADFIEQGGATQRELRTPPLWGVRVRDPLWHDGRVSGGTFASRMDAAIAQHSTFLSEGQASAQAYAGLSGAQKSAVIAFLESLGRARFDDDGDGLVDVFDLQGFHACFTGPGGSLTPDAHCSVHDADQDGDVDGNDHLLFLAATTGGAAGEASRAGAPVPLTLARGSGGTVLLSWGPSCLFTDEDYEVYEGALGSFASHAPRLCSTNGATSASLNPAAGNTYYLVVPHNGFREGSYGRTSAGTERPAGGSACLQQMIGACQ